MMFKDVVPIEAIFNKYNHPKVYRERENPDYKLHTLTLSDKTLIFAYTYYTGN